ncbi:MAG: universal stress protein [Candidatus Binatia bacterium]
MKIKRILVPVDFSRYSLKALDDAADLAAPFGAELVAVFVIEPIYYAMPDFVGAGGSVGSVVEEQRQSAERELAKLRERQERRGRRLRTLVRSGAPHEGIVDAAAAVKASLIVMATHGRTGLTHVLMGSVAERVVRSAPCPVLTIKPRRPSRE